MPGSQDRTRSAIDNLLIGDGRPDDGLAASSGNEEPDSEA
jgi:hypothetical protein